MIEWPTRPLRRRFLAVDIDATTRSLSNAVSVISNALRLCVAELRSSKFERIQSMHFRKILVKIAALLVIASPLVTAAAPSMTVYKTPTCGCCGKWVEHMKANGFQVIVHDVPSTAAFRRKQGIPDRLQSCHTAVVNGYTIEGHVPAADVKRLLSEKPKAVGIVVPGMPMGSPGMEGARSDSYSVILLGENGSETVYQRYAGK